VKKKALLFTVCITVLVVLALSITVFATANENSEPTLKIAKNSLELQNAVFMNFKVESANIDNTSDIKLLVWESAPAEYSKDTASATLSSLHTEEDTGYIVFQYDDLAAKDMTKQIYVCAYANVDGTDVYSKPVKFSIIQYAYNTLTSDSSTQELKNLLTNMLSYGASAQIYFNHNTDFLATDTVAKIKVVNGTHTDGFSTGYYKAGTSVTLTANAADESYVFSHWEDSEGNIVGTESTLTINECTSETYTAVYRGETAIESQGLAYSVNEDRTTCKITGIGNCKDTQLYIPSEIDGYRVTIIGDRAFIGCTSLTSVKIPNSVTRIGEYAFWDCIKLTSLTIPDNVVSIGGYAFIGCTSLTSVTIPNGVTNINGMFCNCTSLTNITIPSSVTSLDSDTFYGCTSLTNISVDINNKYYKSIDGNLYSNDGKTLVRYSIGKLATSFIIPDSVTSIEDSAFSDCSSLTSVTIPDSVTSIGSYAFSNCTSLISITIPDSVTSIGYQAFYDCTSLTSVTMSDSITSIGDWIFKDCTNLVGNIYDGAQYLGDDINKYIFLFKASNTTTTINSNTKFIGCYAFSDCTNLTSITIPDSVTSIGSYAFSNCTSLTSITIPNNVTNIGNGAFGNCTSLMSITIPDRITSISFYAFSGCTNLTSIAIPVSVTSIGYQAFKDCSSLATVYYNGTESDWNNIDIMIVNSITSATRYYYSKTQPTTEGNYWRYVDGVPTKW